MLHDVSKNNLDRSDPQPNTHDLAFMTNVPIINTPRQAHKTISSHYDAGADAVAGFLQMQNKQLIASDGTTPIGLYGYNAALASWGFFLTQAGTDVTTNTDLSKFIFNSNQDAFKIVTTKTVDFSLTSTGGGAASTTASITHGLGYVPFTLSSVSITADWNGNSGIFNTPYFIPATVSGYAGFQLASYVRVGKVTTSQIIYEIGQLAGGTTISGTIKTYFLQETAN